MADSCWVYTVFIFNMLAKEFYTIIQNEESTTNFLISKNLLVNVENIL